NPLQSNTQSELKALGTIYRYLGDVNEGPRPAMARAKASYFGPGAPQSSPRSFHSMAERSISARTASLNDRGFCVRFKAERAAAALSFATPPVRPFATRQSSNAASAVSSKCRLRL